MRRPVAPRDPTGYPVVRSVLGGPAHMNFSLTIEEVERLAMANHNTTLTLLKTIGMDLGDRWNHLVVLSEDGEVLAKKRVPTTKVAMTRLFGSLERCLVVIEAGAHSPWVSRLLAECGHEVIVASPDAASGNKKRGRKNDFRDAEHLARQGRADPRLLRPIKHRGEAAQLDLAFLRARDCLVRMRTKGINLVRGTTKIFGERLSGCDTNAFHHRAREPIPEKLRNSLWPILDTIEHLSRQIKQYDREIAKLCKKYPETKRLMQVTGVGPVTATGFVLTLEEPDRFPKSRKAGPYIGLVPKQNVSCAQNPQLGITKAGNKHLRRLLVSSARYILGPLCRLDSDLRRHGEAIARRGGKNARKRAAVAVARKLAVVLHRLWVTGDAYEPLRQGQRRRQRA